jgi:hypothetical protein
MPILLQISILIIVIVGVVHVVYEKGKKQGYDIAFEKGKLEGISVGRLQVLEEEVIRGGRIIDYELMELRQMEDEIAKISQ